MGELRFPPGARTIRLSAFATGPSRKRTELRMIFDPGAGVVVLRSRIARRLGYDLRVCPGVTVHSAHQADNAPQFSLAKVEALGHAVEGIEAIAIDLPAGLGADGLLGNTFLAHFDVAFNLRRGFLRLTPAGE